MFLFGLGTGVATLIAKEFSKTLSPAEFSAAGLTKLSAEELERLNALIEKQRSGLPKSNAAQQQAPAIPGNSVKAPRTNSVMLAPGTTIEYAQVETQLTGSFRGYEPGTVLSLANGQRWRVVDGTYWASAKSADKVRKVVIEPGVLGSFFLRIDDGGRPKVRYAGPTN
jgi:hypothetical protein